MNVLKKPVTLMKLYIIRHAEPDYPNKTITETGHIQARALAERLKTEGITHIYTSPFGRAMHTMQYTADKLELPFVVEEWMRELSALVSMQDPVHGTFTAFNIDGVTVRSALPLPDHENWHKRRPLNNPKILETFESLTLNSDKFLAKHGYVRQDGIYHIRKANEDRIAVFCHDGFARTWIAHLLEIPLSLMWAGFILSPSSVTTVRFADRNVGVTAPRCMGLGDTTHLHKTSWSD